MYCDKCGFNNLDDAKFCEKCGNNMGSTGNSNYSNATDYSGATDTTSTVGATGSTGGMGSAVAAASSQGKKIIAAIIAVLAVIGVWMLLSNTVCSNMSKNDPIKYYVKAINSSNPSTMLKTQLPEVQKVIKEAWKDDKDIKKDAKKTLKDMKEDDLDNKKLKYKVTDADQVKKGELGDITDSVNAYLKTITKGTDVEHKDVKVTDAYDIAVEMSYGSKEDDTSFRVIKVGGKWYLDPTSSKSSAIQLMLSVSSKSLEDTMQQMYNYNYEY